MSSSRKGMPFGTMIAIAVAIATAVAVGQARSGPMPQAETPALNPTHNQGPQQ